MSDSTRQPTPEITPPNPSVLPGPAGAPVPGGGEPRSEARESGPDATAPVDPTIELKRTAHLTRLPPELRDEIVAQLPPQEEMERMLRELMETGSPPFEEWFGALVREIESKP